MKITVLRLAVTFMLASLEAFSLSPWSEMFHGFPQFLQENVDTASHLPSEDTKLIQMTEQVIMMLLSFLGTTHIKLILFPRSQILKRTAAHTNTQIHTHYLPKPKMRSTCT